MLKQYDTNFNGINILYGHTKLKMHHLQCCGRAHCPIILGTTKFALVLIKSMNETRRLLLYMVVLLNKRISNLKPAYEIQ